MLPPAKDGNNKEEAEKELRAEKKLLGGDTIHALLLYSAVLSRVCLLFPPPLFTHTHTHTEEERLVSYGLG